MKSRWAILFVLCTFAGLLSFSIAYTSERLDGEIVPVLYPFINEMTGAYGVFALLPLLIRFMNRFPIKSENWYRHVPLHGIATIIFGVTHTLWMTATRIVLYPLARFGDYKFGDPFFRFVMEYQKQFMIYVAIYLGNHFVREYQRNRERERKTAELELHAEQLKAKVAEAQLQALKGQIQPHFLFNTLNMISSTMYEDVKKADRLITRLSSLLRMSLEQASQDRIPLRRELEFLELYFEIMKARFEDKFLYQIHVGRDAENVLVPALLLQPLAENAIKHNEADVIQVEIRALREGETLSLQIIDNGGGLQTGSPVERGIGLSNTRDRLMHLYGNRQSLQLENRPEGGLRVTIRIPYEPEPGPIIV